MASKAFAIAALLLTFNLLFFSLVSSTYAPCPPPPHKLKPKPKPSPSPKPSCPRDTLKLGACVDLLKAINLNIGTPPKEPCCSLIQNLADLEAAACLCTTIKANILGIHLTLPVDVSLLLNYCGRKVPSGFVCA